MRLLSLLLFPVAVVSLLACMRQSGPPGNPPPTGLPVELWFSVENSAANAPTLDALGPTLTSLATKLSQRGVDYRILLFRSTENADGIYDARPQGPTPIVRSTDADPASELLADLAALRAAYLGTKAQPVEILARAAAISDQTLNDGRRRLLTAIGMGDATNYFEGPNADMGSYYAVGWDWFFGAGNWSTMVFDSLGGEYANTMARAVLWNNNKLVPGGHYEVSGVLDGLVEALANW